MIDACDGCLRRTDLIAALAGRIEIEWRRRRGRPRLLALADETLLDWGGDAGIRRRYERFSPPAARERIERAGLGAVCRCRPAYPAALRQLPDPPAVLHLRGVAPPADEPAVAIVGARRASGYGLAVAESLGRGLSTAGVTVVSGMALGVDSAAHAGALDAGRTMAVLAGGADVPYPPSKRALHARIGQTGALISEMPPGTGPHRWAFPARNRIIAALAAGTVVVEGNERSGSLITADFAAELGRFVAAVPGQVTARSAAGPNLLLKAGAELVRGPGDLLELLFGAAGPPAPCGTGRRVGDGQGEDGERLPVELRELLERIEAGAGSVAELSQSVDAARRVAAALGELELRGLVRRTFGGRYIRAA